MKNMLPSASKQNEEVSNRKRARPSATERLTHDILNQLSIISLCCCELRNWVEEKLEPEQVKELGRIEIAVQEAAEMLEGLNGILQDHPLTVSDVKSESILHRGEKCYPASSRPILLRR